MSTPLSFRIGVTILAACALNVSWSATTNRKGKSETVPVRIEVPTQSIPVRISEDAIRHPIQVHVVNDTPWWKRAETITPACALGVALLAFFLSLSQARAQRRSVQLQTFESALQRIGENHVAYKERYEIRYSGRQTIDSSTGGSVKTSPGSGTLLKEGSLLSLGNVSSSAILTWSVITGCSLQRPAFVLPLSQLALTTAL